MDHVAQKTCPACGPPRPLTLRSRKALSLKGDGNALWCAWCGGKWDCTDANEDEEGSPHEIESQL